jgi:NAD(P)-dependent dehydrogenase (short-subunit alcohol dehydrogenase family)
MGEATVHELSPKIAFNGVDVSDRQAVQAWVDDVVERHGRMAEARYVGKAHVFPAPDEARFVYGTVSRVDGGIIDGTWRKEAL